MKALKMARFGRRQLRLLQRHSNLINIRRLFSHSKISFGFDSHLPRFHRHFSSCFFHFRLRRFHQRKERVASHHFAQMFHDQVIPTMEEALTVTTGLFDALSL